jgi:hypothetical protein
VKDGAKQISFIQRLKSNTQLGSFFLCVLVAFGIWIVNALNQVQVTKINIPISYFSNQEGTKKSPDLIKKIEVTLNGRGFDLLFFLLKNPLKNLEINERKFQTGRDSVNSFDILAPFINGYPEVKINNITPEWLKLPTGPAYQKKVAVIPQYSLSFEKGFMQSGPIVCVPDSIVIASDHPINEDFVGINTKTIQLINVRATVFKTIHPDIQQKGVFYDDSKKIWIYIPVDASTEKRLLVNILPDNSNLHHALLLPATTEVTCTVPLKYFDSTNAEGFQFSASILQNGQSKAVVNLKKKPFWVQDIRWTPTTVDYIYH